LLTIGFIEYVKEVTWMSPIIVVPKKNGKLSVYINFKKLYATTKKDPYPLLFYDEMLNTIIGYEA
jgi:poly(A) polymerase Pap1